MVQYWYARRPKSIEHQHPFLIFDCQDRLHLPLTRFAKEACARLDPKTVQTYLYAVLSYFTWLDTDTWQVRMGQTWSASPQRVRRSIDDYLVQKLKCQLLPQRQGWKYVAMSVGTHSSLRIFFAAMKLFYQVMWEQGTYSFANPLVDPMRATIAAALAHLEREESQRVPPRMPDESGVEVPRPKPRHRLTDSYYKLEHDEWQPQILDDPHLPGYILTGGRKLSLKYTRLRDETVTWLLFETGARVSEVCGLMLADWVVLGTQTKAKAFSKGSAGRRVKTISFAEDTAILLRRYFDEERLRFDPHRYQLDDYLLLGKQQQIDLSTIPLFLTSQGTRLTPKAYREQYWNPACQVAGLEADVHQARHWHVTQEVRDIYETTQNAAEIERRLRDLIDYMKWKSDETLVVYEHYFNAQRDADTRDALQRRMHIEVQLYLDERRRGKQGKQAILKQKAASTSAPTVQQFDDEPNLSFLYNLAGER